MEKINTLVVDNFLFIIRFKNERTEYLFTTSNDSLNETGNMLRGPLSNNVIEHIKCYDRPTSKFKQIGKERLKGIFSFSTVLTEELTRRNYF